MSPEKRRSPESGIWLCANCHTLIDKDEQKFPSSLLRSWKEFAELRAEKERGMRTSRMNEEPQFQAKICSIIGDNLNKYLKNAMSLEGFPNFNNWPPVYGGQNIVVHPQCIKNNKVTTVKTASLNTQEFGMDWGLIGFYIANIGNTPSRNVAFRVTLPAKPIVFAWDRIYYTLEDKLEDDHSLYQCSLDEKRGIIIEGTVGNITNREGMIKELLLIRFPSVIEASWGTGGCP